MTTRMWRKSSYSDSPTSDCVEVALGAVAFVRDSKTVGGPVLTFDVPAWQELISACRRSG
jgi:hypothetical protein